MQILTFIILPSHCQVTDPISGKESDKTAAFYWPFIEDQAVRSKVRKALNGDIINTVCFMCWIQKINKRPGKR